MENWRLDFGNLKALLRKRLAKKNARHSSQISQTNERATKGHCAMAKLDQTTARSLVEAGYMPLTRYVEMFSGIAEEPDHREALIVPEIHVDYGSAFGTARYKKTN
jgi:hypothetical protein